MTLRIGLIGLGAIGRTVAEAIQEGHAGDSLVAAVLVRDRAKHQQDASSLPCPVTSNPAYFFKEEMSLVVEAAGHEAVRRYAVDTLISGRDLLTLSVGAFADESLLAKVKEAAAASGRQILVPSGAIGGLDAVAAAAVGGLDEVTITTRKPPRAWRGTVAEGLVDLEGLKEPVCLYEGPARQAALLYPQNVNVQAALSLAGIGMDRTRSRIFADPTVSHNTHEIVARGSFGEIRISIGNVPSAGSAKTGRLTAMSVIKAIRNRTAPLVIGL